MSLNVVEAIVNHSKWPKMLKAANGGIATLTTTSSYNIPAKSHMSLHLFVLTMRFSFYVFTLVEREVLLGQYILFIPRVRIGSF